MGVASVVFVLSIRPVMATPGPTEISRGLSADAGDKSTKKDGSNAFGTIVTNRSWMAGSIRPGLAGVDWTSLVVHDDDKKKTATTTLIL